MKDFVFHEEALALKELGFDEECFGFYDTEGLQITYHASNRTNKNSLFTEHGTTNNPKISAPTFSQAFRWFKQNHKLKFHIREDMWNAWCYVHILMRDEYESVGDYSTYEEAELACLRKLIEIVKQKQ